jgi:hypothetical protein
MLNSIEKFALVDCVDIAGVGSSILPTPTIEDPAAAGFFFVPKHQPPPYPANTRGACCDAALNRAHHAL